MTLIVKGTLQSEFFTIFCPMRFTYSSTTGSVMNLVLFSISSANCLPILISPSVEYQLPNPRLPISRLPTAPTSSILPVLIGIIWLPGSTILSTSTATGPAQSPPTAVVPGSGLSAVSFVSFESLSFLSAFFPVSQGASCVLLAVVELVVDGLVVEAVPESGCFAGAGASPPTGVVPGAGCAVCPQPLLAAGVVLGAVPPAGALACAHTPTLAASAIPARTVILKT